MADAMTAVGTVEPTPSARPLQYGAPAQYAGPGLQASQVDPGLEREPDMYSNESMDRFMEEFYKREGGNPYNMDINAMVREGERYHLPRLLHSMSGGRIPWNRRNRMTKSESIRFRKAARDLSGNIRRDVERKQALGIQKANFMYQQLRHQQQVYHAKVRHEEARREKFRIEMMKAAKDRIARLEAAVGRAVELSPYDKGQLKSLQTKQDENNEIIRDYNPDVPEGGAETGKAGLRGYSPTKAQQDSAMKENAMIEWNINTHYNPTLKERVVRGEAKVPKKPGAKDAEQAPEPEVLPEGIQKQGDAYYHQDPETGNMFASDDLGKLTAMLEGRKRMGAGGGAATGAAPSAPGTKRTTGTKGQEIVTAPVPKPPPETPENLASRILAVARKDQKRGEELLKAFKKEYTDPEHAGIIAELEKNIKLVTVEL